MSWRQGVGKCEPSEQTLALMDKKNAEATAVREALEALSLWITGERQKYRVAGGMPAGGFDNMTPIEVALAKVETEIDRRAALAHTRPHSNTPHTGE